MVKGLKELKILVDAHIGWPEALRLECEVDLYQTVSRDLRHGSVQQEDELLQASRAYDGSRGCAPGIWGGEHRENCELPHGNLSHMRPQETVWIWATQAAFGG